MDWDPGKNQGAALANTGRLEPRNGWLDKSSRTTWKLGMFGVCLAVVIRVLILVITNPKVAAPETRDWLAPLSPIALGGAALCLVACLLGALVYLRRHISDWVLFVFGEIVTIAGTAALTGFFGFFLLSMADSGGEAVREIAAAIGSALVLGIIFLNRMIIDAWLEWADRDRAGPKKNSGPQGPRAQDIILD